MRSFTVRTDRRTQLIDITRDVQGTLGEASGHAGEAGATSERHRKRRLGGASAVLVYIPHTTAGVTGSEGADPAVARDLEAAMEKIVEDGWDWKHVEDPDGPNAPSHVRASLVSPQVLVPVDGDRLALGTWQGIFLCEFDGPRERKVFVTPLH
jgi:secondary thiamine-phosphate synthase enzyme